MKKIFVTLGLLIFIVSCSDDSGMVTEQNKELIFGIWRLHKVYDKNGMVLKENRCEKKKILEVKADGIYEFPFVIEDRGAKELHKKIPANLELRGDRMVMHSNGKVVKQGWVYFPNENTFELTGVIDEVNEGLLSGRGNKEIWLRVVK